MERALVKLYRAINYTEKAHVNDRTIQNALYGAGIEKEDCKGIMEFLAARIEDQYYSSTPAKEVQDFIDKLKSMSKEIEKYIIM